MTALRRQTLEQLRARDAWDKSAGCSKEYRNLAKALPALIMNSGLMQVMAFLHQKGEKDPAHRKLAADQRGWLHRQVKTPEAFEPIREALMVAQPAYYRDVTAEAFAWLRWMRQMASARVGED